MNNNDNKEPVSLVLWLAADGSLPLSKGHKYYIRDGLHRDVWLWTMSGFQDVEDDKPIYALGEYPPSIHSLMANYMDKDWFNAEDFKDDLSAGFDLNKTEVYAEYGYDLSKQDLEYDEGRIIAHDEETGIIRELVRVSIRYKDENYGSFLYLSDGKDITIDQYKEIISSDNKNIPELVRAHWKNILDLIETTDKENIKIKTDDVYVLIS